MKAKSRTTCVRIIRYERTIYPESRGQYLNGLEKLILPMYFLKADDVVVFDKSAEVVMLSFPRSL